MRAILNMLRGLLKLRTILPDREVVEVSRTGRPLQDFSFEGALAFNAEGHENKIFASLVAYVGKAAEVLATLDRTSERRHAFKQHFAYICRSTDALDFKSYLDPHSSDHAVKVYNSTHDTARMADIRPRPYMLACVQISDCRRALPLPLLCTLPHGLRENMNILSTPSCF